MNQFFFQLVFSFIQFEVSFFEFELAQGELVHLFCAIGSGLFALAALFFAVFVALVARDCLGFFLSLTFSALKFAQLAAGLCCFIALLANVAGVGAFHDGVEADDLRVGFDPGFFGESWQSCCETLERDSLHDGGVVFEHGFDARVGW